MDLVAADTRVFLFHSPDASGDAGGAMDKVNAWLGKDRSESQYPNLRIKDISVTPDGKVVYDGGRVQWVHPFPCSAGTGEIRNGKFQVPGTRQLPQVAPPVKPM